PAAPSRHSHEEARMVDRRLLSFFLVLPLLAGCAGGARYASFSDKTWDKAGGTQGELKKDRQACRQETGVGADDPRPVGGVRLTPAEKDAGRADDRERVEA